MTNSVGMSARETPRVRGASFPVLPLPAAVKIVRDAGSYGRQHSRSAIATYAGHTTDRSGPFRQKLAALKDWGFITMAGDSVVLTDAAMKIAHPRSPEESATALQGAFRGCRPFWRIYEKSAKGRELDLAALGNAAVRDIGVAAPSKDKFVQSLVESAEAVGLAQRLAGGKIHFTLTHGDPLSPGPAVDDSPPATAPGQASAANIGRPGRLSPVVSQLYPFSSGEILFEIRSSQPIVPAAFERMGKILQQVQDLARALSSETGE